MLKQLLKFKAAFMMALMCMLTSSAYAGGDAFFGITVTPTPTGAGKVYATPYEDPVDEHSYVDAVEYTSSGVNTAGTHESIFHLYAKANPGFRFDGWALAEDPETILSTDEKYTLPSTPLSTDKENPTFLGNYIAKFTQTHFHAWEEAWTKTETAHYHACTAEDCYITDYAVAPLEASYGEHEYGENIAETSYYTCSVCQYVDAALKAEYLAEPVIKLIDAIGPVSDSFATAKAISDARIAYDNLTAAAKACVTNYDDLVAAETLYNQMVSFDSYRNSRSWLLGIRLTQFDNAEVRRQVADAAQKIQALEFVEELTLEENKKRVDDIYNTYLDILKKSRHDAVVADLLEVAKHNGKASIMLFVAASDSQRAIDAANEGIAKIDALEYDYEADLSANLDDVFDIVIDTKINIVNAWKADFEDLKAEIIDKIRRIIGIGSQAEAKVAGMSYDYSLTREQNNAKLNDVMQSLGGTTGINVVNAASAKNGKYVENGKIVIVKNGKAYTAAGQMK